MGFLKLITLPLLFICTVSFGSLHKYYVSNTQITYVEAEKSVQIISRIFMDDLESVLRERYDEDISLDNENTKLNDFYIEKYLNEKLKIKIDGMPADFIFIGKEIEMGIVKCYLEIGSVEHIGTFEVSNKTLFDTFSEQQNIIKLDINSKHKSFVLSSQNEKALLNFN